MCCLRKNGNCKIPVNLNLLKPHSATSHLNDRQSIISPNKGIGRDRSIQRVLNEAGISGDGDKSWAMAFQQMIEVKAQDNQKYHIATGISLAAGIISNVKELPVESDVDTRP